MTVEDLSVKIELDNKRFLQEMNKTQKAIEDLTTDINRTNEFERFFDKAIDSLKSVENHLTTISKQVDRIFSKNVSTKGFNGVERSLNDMLTTATSLNDEVNGIGNQKGRTSNNQDLTALGGVAQLGSAGVMASATAEMTANLQGVNAEWQSIENALTAVRRQYDAVNQEAMIWRENIRDTKLEIADNEKDLRDLNNGINPDNLDPTEIENLIAYTNELKESLVSTEQKYQSLQVHLKELTQQIGELEYKQGLLTEEAQEYAKNLKETGKSADEAGKNIKKAGNDIEDTGNKAKKSEKAIAKFSKVLAGITAVIFAVKKVSQFVKDATDMASQLEEVQNVVDVSFGSMKDGIDDFAKSAKDSFGISELTAKKMASTFMAMANSTVGFNENSAKMSQNLTKLSADMASFYNVQTDVAQTALQSVFTGETESLKKFGIVMTEANLQQHAFSLGIQKSVRDMSEAEKVALRYNFVMTKTANVQGDFVRTSGSWANQTRLLKEQFNELKVVVGQGLIQAFLPVVQFLNALLERLTAVAIRMRQVFGFKNVQTDTNKVVDGFGEVGSTIDGATNSAKELKKTIAGFDELNLLADNRNTGNAPAAGGSTIDLSGLTDIGKYDIPLPDYEAISEELYDKFKPAIDIIIAIVDAIGFTLKSVWDIIKSGLQFFSNIFNDFKLLFEGIKELVSGMSKHNYIDKNDGMRKIKIAIAEALVDVILFFEKLSIDLSGWFLKIIATIKHPFSEEARQEEFDKIDQNVADAKEDAENRKTRYENDARNNINAKYDSDDNIKPIIDKENEERIRKELNNSNKYLLDTKNNVKETIAQINSLGYKSDNVITTIRKKIAGMSEDGVADVNAITGAMEDNIMGFGDLMALGYSYEEAMALAGSKYNEITAITNENLDQSKYKTDAFNDSLDETNNKMDKSVPDNYFKAVKDGADNSTNSVKNSSLAMDGFNIGTGKALSGAKDAFNKFVNDWNNKFGTLNNAIDLRVNDATQSGKAFWTQFKTGVRYQAQVDALNITNTAMTPSGQKLTTTNRVVAFANGGVLTTPTVGLMAEYAGAHTNPEIITPESKMREVFGEGNNALIEVWLQTTRQIIGAIENKDMSVSIGDDEIANSIVRSNNASMRRNGTSLFAF